jgi:predicted nucleic-acid-binding protein
MIGLDSNILVRYLTQDDPVQSPRATAILEHRLTAENPGFISTVALAETVWVLERAYGFSDKEIASAIERMLQPDALVVEREHDVFTAVVALKKGTASFSGALIAAVGTSLGCRHTLTFDRKALRLRGFEPA